MQDGEKTEEIRDKILPLLESEKENNKGVQELYDLRQYIVKKSNWLFGGDGWAYDIGFGGLDHVLATGDDINVLVMDTKCIQTREDSLLRLHQRDLYFKFAS